MLAASFGVWRDRVHPRFKDQKPALDWAAVRSAFDPATGVPWAQLRAILFQLEAGARQGAAEASADDDE